MLINNYVAYYRPDHPRAMSNGMVYEHILVAEKSIGRLLKDGEVVHHKDHCKTNNSPENLMVFRGHSDHAKFHMGGICVRLDDGSYIVPEYKFQSGRYDECPKCGGKKSKRSKLCERCNMSQYVIPSREELINLIAQYNNNKSAIGRLYNVSQTAVRHWIKKYKI